MQAATLLYDWWPLARPTRALVPSRNNPGGNAHDRMTESKSSKVILIAVSALAATAVLLATVAALALRVNAKPRVEASASEALGMEVHVVGRLAIGFLPGLHVALADVHLRQRGAEVASAGEVDLGIELLPLLRKEL